MDDLLKKLVTMIEELNYANIRIQELEKELSSARINIANLKKENMYLVIENKLNKIKKEEDLFTDDELNDNKKINVDNKKDDNNAINMYVSVVNVNQEVSPRNNIPPPPPVKNIQVYNLSKSRLINQRNNLKTVKLQNNPVVKTSFKPKFNITESTICDQKNKLKQVPVLELKCDKKKEEKNKNIYDYLVEEIHARRPFMNTMMVESILDSFLDE